MGHRPLRREEEPTYQIQRLKDRTDALERRFPGPLPVVLFIKVSGDQTLDPVLAVGDKQFEFQVSEDMDGYRLTRVEGYVTTVSSSGTVTVQLALLGSNGGGSPNDMLSTRLTIDSGERNARTAAVPVVIDTAHDDVSAGDHIRIDVDVAGTGTKGLGVMLTFEWPGVDDPE